MVPRNQSVIRQIVQGIQASKNLLMMLNSIPADVLYRKRSKEDLCSISTPEVDVLIADMWGKSMHMHARIACPSLKLCIAWFLCIEQICTCKNNSLIHLLLITQSEGM